ncbi:MAG: anthranilate synthase component I family protein [Crocinitomicaceae bacterium]
MSWFDITTRIEPNDLTLFLRDAKNFIIGWDFDENLAIDGNVDFELVDSFIDSNKGKFIFTNLGYDLKNSIELKLNSKNHDFLGFPNVSLKCPKNVIQAIQGELYFFGDSSIEDVKSLLLKEKKSDLKQRNSVHIEQIESKEEYISKIDKIKTKIQRGDIYEMNYCTAFLGSFKNLNPLNTFEELFNKTESPFSVYERISNKIILNTSPERFISKEQNEIISQPIKGTAPKGSSVSENDRIISNLKSDLKEITENVMIVDLVRNDLSKIASKNSVETKKLFEVHSFKNINQLISTISCNLKSDIKFADIIKSTFPMGSMTGAPKISAMSISEENEIFSRNLYSGAQGYIAPNFNIDLNVVIRTIFVNEIAKSIFVAVGGAITTSSVPEKEYEECLEKIKAIKSVIC